MRNLLDNIAPVMALRKASALVSELKAYGAIVVIASLASIGFPNPSMASDHRAAAAQPATGSLDTAFGSGGTVLTNMTLPSLGDSVAVQSDGKLVVGGFSISANAEITDIPGSAVARYNGDGSLDTTFGNGGIVSLVQPPGFAIFAVAILPNGQVLLGGAQMTTVSATTAQPEMARLNSDGSLDGTFGSFGTVISGSGVILSMVIQPNGQIVAGGMINSGGVLMFGVSRYNSDGGLDGTFGTGGEVTTSFNAAFSVALQTDGSIVAGGVGGVSSNNLISGFPNVFSGGQFALIRLNTEGILDTTFGNGGQVQTPLLNASSIATIAVESNGEILAAGTALTASGALDFALAEYTTSGSLDSTFGNGGATTVSLDGNDDTAYGMILQADGRIVVAGSSFNASAQPANSNLFLFPVTGVSGGSIVVARFNTNGSLDTTFGSGGSAITSLQQGVAALGVTIPQDGEITVVGASEGPAGVLEFALAQYDAGTLTGDFALSESQASVTMDEGTPITLPVNVEAVAGSTPPSSVTLSASVVPNTSGISATFSTGSTPTGTTAMLTLTPSSTTVPGSFSLFITGAAGSITHTIDVSLTVTGSDFTLTLASPIITGTQGDQFFPVISINRFGGFNGKVIITAQKTDLPTGVSFLSKTGHVSRRFRPTVQFKYKTRLNAVPGTYFLTFTGTDLTGRVRTATLTLIVPPLTSGS
ncbi:MAG TPA: hypothetical protein VI756_18285 [Blastocatellia bacterium]